MIELKIYNEFHNVAVPVCMWSKKKNKFEEIIALFDTGAHTSSIDIELFFKLGYNLNEATNSAISTATRTYEKVHKVVIDRMMLDNTEINSVLFNTYEFPLVMRPVIIGMNIIRNFEVNMNFKKKLITMSENYLAPDDYYNADIFGDWRADIKN